MNGFVDENGRALLSLSLRADSAAEDFSVDAWVDTGFTAILSCQSG